MALLDSGTSALAVALRFAAQRRPGRPVLLPAWGCYDLATAADAAEVEVGLYDLDPATLGPDWDSLASGLRGEPAAVVAVHFFGVPVDLQRLSTLTRAAGAALIEDAAQGAGGELGGKPLGAWGDLSLLSFGRGKGLTGGRGGALLAHQESWREAVATVALPPGRESAAEAIALLAQWLLTRPGIYRLPASLPWLGLGQTVYHPPHPAAGLSALAAGTLAVTLDLAISEADRRRRHAAWLRERIALGACQVPSGVAGGVPGWLRLPVVLPREQSAALSKGSARALGIYPGYPLALAELPGFGARLTERNTPTPGARELARRLVTLPTHGGLRDADLERLVAWCGRQIA